MDVPEEEPEDAGDTAAETTRLLRLAAEGEPGALEDLVPLLYDELRRLAGSYLGRERDDHTLQATALVHEAYVRLLGDRAGFADRAHFFRAAATTMRRILVDHARGKRTAKRGGDRARSSLDEVLDECEERSGDMIDLDGALGELKDLDPVKARLVDLRFFGGLSLPEAARIEGLALRTAERHWTMARAFLASRLEGSWEDG